MLEAVGRLSAVGVGSSRHLWISSGLLETKHAYTASQAVHTYISDDHFVKNCTHTKADIHANRV